MNEKFSSYLDGIFASYEDSHAVKELKEELLHDLNEKYLDLKNQGYDDETAYRMTINSVGDIAEIMESASVKKKELLQMVRRDLSATDLRNSDLKGVAVHDGTFNASDLHGTDFSGSDLTNTTFKSCMLEDVRFDGANLSGAKFLTSALKNSSFTGCVLDNTSFRMSDLSGVNFDNQTLMGTIFDNTGIKGTSFRNAILRDVTFKIGFKTKSDIKKAVFDGAMMDKLTYAVLKGYGANLTNVTVI